MDSNPTALFTYVAEQLNRFGLAYLHIKGNVTINEGQGPIAAECDANCDAIASPDKCHRFYDFQQETRPVLDGTTVGIGPFVTSVLKKLVR